MILYGKTLKIPQKLLQIINSANLPETESTHISHIYILTMGYPKRKQKTIPFTVASNRIKYLTNLREQHLHTENYKHY